MAADRQSRSGHSGALPPAWREALAGFSDAGARLGVLLEGDPEFVDPWLARWRAAMPAGSLEIAGDIGRGRATRLFGQALDGLIIDAVTGLDPNLLGLAAGALRGGGVLLLRLPMAYANPAMTVHRARGHGAPAAITDRRCGRFARRMRRLAAVNAGIGWIAPAGESVPTPPPRPTGPKRKAGRLGTLGHDQAHAVDAILALRGRADDRPTLLLRAERGRGKSTALGLAAANWLSADREARLLFVAARSSALRSARDAFSQAGGDRRRVHELPIERTLKSRPAVDAVFVDEAAALPPHQLQSLLNRHSIAILASTVEGYEGTGRGLDTSFAHWLEHHRPGWRRLDLTTPLRWSARDPLEGFLRGLLNPDARVDAPATPEARRIERVDRERLVDDDRLLGQISSLLAAAHYRTRPSNLESWLDAPDVALWTLHEGAALGAVAVTVREGGVAAPTVADVVAGRRRVRGHQLAQSLAAHAGIGAALATRGVRVVRVAVRDGRRRQGLGSALLDAVAADAAAAKLEWIGTSFGATAALLAFWHRAGLLPVRLGQRADRVTGRRAALMIRGLSPRGHAIATLGAARLRRDLPWLVTDPDFLVARDVAAGLPGAPAPAPASRHEDRHRIAMFAAGRCGFLTARPALCRLLASHEVDLPILQRRCRDNATWSELCREYGFRSRDAAITALRHAAANLLADG